jgi:cytochrome b subunit of formate dehydrogenase
MVQDRTVEARTECFERLLYCDVGRNYHIVAFLESFFPKTVIYKRQNGGKERKVKRLTQLQDNFKEKRRHWDLKQKVLGRSMWTVA